MKLVLLCGSPGVGKLTVAKELQKITGFRFLHNHLVADAVVSIFDYGNPAAKELNASIKLSLYKVAAIGGVNGVISTFTHYNDNQTQDFLWQCTSLIKKYKGEICCVKLSCDFKTLKKRIKSRSRANTKKIRSVAKLKRVLASNTSLQGEDYLHR
ncbi:MAG: AAA family ATPase [bacterium]|nr:AAA family ATPase [bacterium]